MFKNKKKEYLKSLKNLSWKKDNNGFYEWLKNESIHKCSPNNIEFSRIYKKWTIFTPNYKLTKIDTKEWKQLYIFYEKLCDYSYIFFGVEQF